VKVEDILDHLGILEFGAANSHFPIFHRRLPRHAAKLHECGSGYRSGGVNTIPAMNKDGLRFVFDGVVNLLMNGSAAPALPAMVDIVE